MSLIDLKTKFKGLKHGKDRPGGGSSNQPYIVTKIPEGSSLIPNTPDSLGRGGLIAGKRAIEDVGRLSQMFVDFKSPSGLMFTPKMNILSRTSVKTEATEGVGYGMGLINQGVYSPTSTLLQAVSGFIGGHAELLGLNTKEWSLNKYEDVIKENIINYEKENDKNRLTNLYKVHFLNSPSQHPMVPSGGGETLLEYSGGSDSTLGIGTTIIKKVQVGQQFKKPQMVKDLGSNGVIRTLTPLQLGEKEHNKGIQEDFRTLIIQGISGSQPVENSSILSLSPSYISESFERRTNMGVLGKYNTKDGKKQVFNYGLHPSSSEALDKINAWGMYTGSQANGDLKDLIQFNIASLDNDSDESVYIHFRAFLDSFSDTFSSTHTSQTYVGRGEKFNNYVDFDRDINLSFKVVAQSKSELIPMYKKLNYLASNLAPDYSGGGFMRGNIVKLTVGGYLFEQPGIIRSLSYNINSDSTWEIGIDENGKEDESVKELPHIIEVTNFSFIPIHNFLVQKPKNFNKPDQRFISLNNQQGGKGNYNDEYKIQHLNKF